MVEGELSSFLSNETELRGEMWHRKQRMEGFVDDYFPAEIRVGGGGGVKDYT